MYKILFVISEDTYFYSHRFDLAKRAQANGYEVALATQITSEKLRTLFEKNNISVFDTGIRSKGIGIVKNIKLLPRLRKIFNNYQPGIVHAVSIRMVFIALFSYHISKCGYFIGLISGLGHLDTSEKKSIKLLKKFVFITFRFLLMSGKTSLIVQNDDDYYVAIRNLVNEKRCFKVKGSGVNIVDFPFFPAKDKDNIVITFVARMLKDKGVYELYEAARLLQGKFNFVVQLVGDPHPVNPCSLNKAELQAWHNEGIVHWLGHCDDIVEIWRNSDIAVLPSYREGLPKSLLEAAACGRPIITTDVPGCREVCEHGVNGLLVPVKNAQALAEAIYQLASDRSLRIRMGEASRRRVESEFSDKIVNDQVLNIYKYILDEQP